MKFTEEIGPRQQRTRKTQQGGSILGNIIKLGASKLLKQGGGGGGCASTKALVETYIETYIH